VLERTRPAGSRATPGVAAPRQTASQLIGGQLSVSGRRIPTPSPVRAACPAIYGGWSVITPAWPSRVAESGVPV
jgi:hypothetical protein